MSTKWPAALPQAMLIAGYSSSRPAVTLRTPPEKGPQIMRRRGKAGVAPFAGSMVMTLSQRNALDVFFDVTLAGGAKVFTLPAQDGTADIWFCRFVGPPEEEQLTGTHWRVEVALERMPNPITVGAEFSDAFSDAFAT